MTSARLQYVRNLKKELSLIDYSMRKEQGKKRPDSEKIARLNETLKEVDTEYKKVAEEIKKWLADLPVHNDVKLKSETYYLEANTVTPSNLARTLKGILGEEPCIPRNYKYEKKDDDADSEDRKDEDRNSKDYKRKKRERKHEERKRQKELEDVDKHLLAFAKNIGLPTEIRQLLLERYREHEFENDGILDEYLKKM